VPAYYGHDRRVYSTKPTAVYFTDTTAARWRHTPTKLLPLTSPNPNSNTNPNPNSNPKPYLNPNKSE